MRSTSGPASKRTGSRWEPNKKVIRLRWDTCAERADFGLTEVSAGVASEVSLRAAAFSASVQLRMKWDFPNQVAEGIPVAHLPGRTPSDLDGSTFGPSHSFPTDLLALSESDRLEKEGELQVIYERSLAIGQRLEDILVLIRTGRHSTRTLAAKLGVSEPTISRCLAVLRSRGYEIAPQRTGREWRYVLLPRPTDVPVANH